MQSVSTPFYGLSQIFQVEGFLPGILQIFTGRLAGTR